MPTSIELNHSPADIIRRLMIQLGLGVDPPAASASEWPIHHPRLPGDRPDNAISVKDAVGISNGREMVTGELQQHYGFQVIIRASDSKVGYPKANEIQTTLAKNVDLVDVTIDSSTYLVNYIALISDIIEMGLERPSSHRTLYSINALTTITMRPQA